MSIGTQGKSNMMSQYGTNKTALQCTINVKILHYLCSWPAIDTAYALDSAWLGQMLLCCRVSISFHLSRHVHAV